MNKYIQIYLGGAEGRGITPQDIQRKTERCMNKIDGIIAGWSRETEIYTWLREYTKARNKNLYLWFPVLAEFDGIKDFVQIRDIENRKFEGTAFDGDERFSFYCPSDETTFENIKEIYAAYFKQIGFDGIFLDRIRFPSFVSGRDALFTCCCDKCLEKYRRKGFTPDRIKSIKYTMGRDQSENLLFSIKKYDKGKYEFENPEIEEYLKIRMGLITEIVKKVTAYFRSQGLEIGLDLFAPFLAPFVGQDYEELSGYADFIKPMLYRYTYTPAGMDYELEKMAESCTSKENRAKCLNKYKKVIGCYRNSKTGFMRKELAAAKEMSVCKIMAGMEVHTVDSMPEIKPIQIKEGKDAAEAEGIEGIIACWNILNAPEKNILTFCEEE